MNLQLFSMRLGLALVLGAIVGLERQWRHRMAGTRTNALVSAAACAFAMSGLLVSGEGAASRVIGQIVTGVGFLGAGVIFRDGPNVRGLNTAASVWCSASVGVLSGIGFPQYAVVTAVAVVITNVVFRPLAYKLRPELRDGETNYHLELTCTTRDEGQMRALLLSAVDRNHVTLTALQSEDIDHGGQVRVSAEIKSPSRNDDCLEQLVARVSLEPGVSAVSWRIKAILPALE